MAITLAESAKLSTDSLQKGVLQTFIQVSPVLDRIPLLEIEGNSYAYNEEATLPGVAFRGVNEGYVESTGTFNQKAETIKILGGDADVDRFIQQTRSNLNDQRAEQTQMKVKAISYAYQDAFINGDVDTDPLGFDGLKKRLTGNQVIDGDTNGIKVVGDGKNDVYAFLDKLDELLAAVPGINGTNGALYTNTAIMHKIQSALRHVGLDSVMEQDITGKRTIQWNGIPILDIGTKSDGNTLIIPQDETQGTATNTASIYAVKFGSSEGDQAVTGLTNGGIMVNDMGMLADKPVYRTRVEFYCGLAVFGGKAAARLKGVLNA